MGEVSEEEKARALARSRRMFLMDETTNRNALIEETRIETKLEIAKNGLAQGFSIEVIADLTDLSVDEIKLLQNQSPNYNMLEK